MTEKAGEARQIEGAALESDRRMLLVRGEVERWMLCVPPGSKGGKEKSEHMP